MLLFSLTDILTSAPQSNEGHLLFDPRCYYTTELSYGEAHGIITTALSQFGQKLRNKRCVILTVEDGFASPGGNNRHACVHAYDDKKNIAAVIFVDKWATHHKFYKVSVYKEDYDGLNFAITYRRLRL